MRTIKKEKKRFLPESTLIALALFLFALSGCSVFSPKKEEPSVSISGNDAGLNGAVDGLLVKMRNIDFLQARGPGTRKICFLGVRDVYGHEIPELSESVRRRFAASPTYQFLDDATLEAGLEKSDVKKNDMFIPQEREKLTQALGTELDYFLSARIVRTGEAQKGIPAAESILMELYSVSENTTVRVQRDLNGIYSVAEAKKRVLGIF